MCTYHLHAEINGLVREFEDGSDKRAEEVSSGENSSGTTWRAQLDNFFDNPRLTKHVTSRSAGYAHVSRRESSWNH